MSDPFGTTPAPLAVLLGAAGVCIAALGVALIARDLTEWWTARRARRVLRRSRP